MGKGAVTAEEVKMLGKVLAGNSEGTGEAR